MPSTSDKHVLAGTRVSWETLGRRLTTTAYVILAALLSFPMALSFTGGFKLAIAPHTSWYYVAEHQAELARFLLMASGIWFVALIYLVIRRRPNFLEKALAALCWFGGFVVIAFAGSPTYDVPIHMGRRVVEKMEAVHHALVEWGEKEGRFPKNGAELKEATANLSMEAGPWARGKTRLPYTIIYVANESGPHKPILPGPAPGTIYVAVSSNHRLAWLSGTRLQRLAGNRVIPLYERLVAVLKKDPRKGKSGQAI